jgi:5-hydroxyisourate hydrolase
MSGLSTHVLDTAGGVPVEGIQIDLYKLEGNSWTKLKTVVTNGDGRVDGALLDGGEVTVGQYELVFHFGEYLLASGASIAGPAFLDLIPIRFVVADITTHYHVPLLISPYGYSTYKGS